MLSIPSGVGRELPSRHRADEVPGVLLLTAGRDRAVLHPHGEASGAEHAERAWRDAGDTETGENGFYLTFSKVEVLCMYCYCGQTHNCWLFLVSE